VKGTVPCHHWVGGGGAEITLFHLKRSEREKDVREYITVCRVPTHLPIFVVFSVYANFFLFK
jgi:hypothetical protein